MAERLHIQLLGGLTARREDFGVFRPQASKLGVTFALLAYRVGEQLARDHVVDLVWPEADADSGRHRLRQVLTLLRQRLDRLAPSLGSLLATPHDEVYLDPEHVCTDLAAFMRCVASADRADSPEERLAQLCAAADLYVGDLLPGYYDDWVIAERERVGAVFTRALRSLVRQLDAVGETERALDYALRATQAAPDREDLHFDAMQLYCKLGRQAEALRQYHRISGLLRRDYDREPSEEISRLARELIESGYERLRDRRSREPGDHGGAPRGRPRRNAGPSVLSPALPAALTRFFGREDELGFLSRALDPAARPLRSGGSDAHARRLVTLTGPGGGGKSRLALEAGRLLSEAYGGAVAFVPLAAARKPERILPAILSAIGAPLPTGAGADALEHAARHLGGRPRLLILDNLEDLIPSAAPVLRALLERLPELRILGTSRKPLHIEGETVFRVTPLPVPTRPGTADRLMEFACVQLFVDRAGSVCHDFRLTPDNAGAVAALCERLEGIPLAVELAAGRAHVLTPAQMLAELTDRFGFLVSRRANGDSPHGTLRDAIAWSFDRLSPELQRFFASLSVFRDGWTLAAARQVCGRNPAEALDCLDELAQRSLIVMDERHGAMRFGMLETLREFAAARLDAVQCAELRVRHAAFFEELAEEAEAELRGPEMGRRVAVLNDEHENLRAALEWLGGQGNGAALRMAGALWRYWNARGDAAEGLAHLDRALAGCPAGAGEELVARALLGRGALLYRQTRTDEAEDVLCRSEALFKRCGRRDGIASVLAMRAILAQTGGDYSAARVLVERALALWQALGDQWGVAGTLNNLARLAQDSDEPALAAACYERSREIYQRQGDTAQLATVLNNRGTLAYEQDDVCTAQACFERCLELCRATCDRPLTAVTLHNLGDVACRTGSVAEAFTRLAESLTIRMELGDRAGSALSLESLAVVARLRGDCVRSLRLLAAASALREACGVPLRATEQEQFAQAVSTARTHVSGEVFAAAWQYGRLLTLEEAAACALDAADEREPASDGAFPAFLLPAAAVPVSSLS